MAPRPVWTIVVAGGSGRRFGGSKQYAQLGGERVLDLAVAVARSATDGVVVVVPPEDVAREGGVPAGRTRAESVRSGLAAVPEEAEIICVHDAARPFATAELFASVVAAVRAGADAAVPGVSVTDTIKVVDEAHTVVATPARAMLVAVQTPQAFRASVLRAAHAGGAEGTDDAELVEAIGARVVVVAGDPANRKLTVPEDIAWARAQVGT